MRKSTLLGKAPVFLRGKELQQDAIRSKRYYLDELSNDNMSKEVTLNAIKFDTLNIELIPSHMLEDKEVQKYLSFQLAKYDSERIEALLKSFELTKEEKIEIFYRSGGEHYAKYFTKDMFTEYIIKYLKDNMCLGYIPHELRTEEICIQVCSRSNNNAIEYTPENLRTRNWWLNIMAYRGDEYYRVLPEMYKTKEFFMEMLSICPKCHNLCGKFGLDYIELANEFVEKPYPLDSWNKNFFSENGDFKEAIDIISASASKSDEHLKFIAECSNMFIHVKDQVLINKAVINGWYRLDLLRPSKDYLNKYFNTIIQQGLLDNGNCLLFNKFIRQLDVEILLNNVPKLIELLDTKPRYGIITLDMNETVCEILKAYENYDNLRPKCKDILKELLGSSETKSNVMSTLYNIGFHLRVDCLSEVVIELLIDILPKEDLIGIANFIFCENLTEELMIKFIQKTEQPTDAIPTKYRSDMLYEMYKQYGKTKDTEAVNCSSCEDTRIKGFKTS